MSKHIEIVVLPHGSVWIDSAVKQRAKSAADSLMARRVARRRARLTNEGSAGAPNFRAAA
jgi:hypothetical protein